jgi:triacylglycerol lipase
LKIIDVLEKRNPILLIHGLWNTSSIFSSITSKLDDIGIEYFAPTLKHSYGMTSILDLTNKLNELILEKYGLEKEIDILGFSMGGIIGRYWLQKFNG